MADPIRLVLNGETTSTDCRPDMTVLEWLRGEKLLRGSKEGCAEGDCGACSVLVKRADEEYFVPANSCIMLMGQLEGANLMTVEGIAACGEDGHEIQTLMAQNGSSQCGFCTPGIVCSLVGLLDRNKAPTDSDIHDALAGNLCRCTGYRPIVEAARDAASQGTTQLKGNIQLSPREVTGSSDCIYYSPETLEDLLELRADHPDAVLLGGGTDLSLAVAHAKERWPKIISTRYVSELRTILGHPDYLRFGGAVTWEEALPLLDDYWSSFATLVRRFGSSQIRAMGTIAGNLANASPIGDGAPCLIAIGARIQLASRRGERSLSLEKFFLDYRKSELADDEVIVSVTINKPKPNKRFRVYKISKRYDQDISTVCGAFNLEVTNGTVTSARIAYGGMAATPMRCTEAEQVLIGASLKNEKVWEAVKAAIADRFKPLSDMRGSAEYRARIATNLLDRYLLDIHGETVEVMAL